MGLLLLRGPDILRACPMPEAIEAVAAGFAALSSGQASVPVRLSVPLDEGAVALTMPAALQDARWYAVKVVTVAPRNAERGRPVIIGTVLLGDAASGEALALLDGTVLTALRTGAAGGLAARTLARATARRAVLFGAGAQARTQLLALAAVRPIDDVIVVARDPTHVAAFVGWAAAQPDLGRLRVRAGSAAAVAEADVVVTATTSSTPVFAGRALARGTQVTAVGSFTPDMRELDEDTLRGARIVVDQRAAALAEAGELQGRRADELVELGEILAGRAPGRSTDDERTVFKTVGNAVEDLVVAARAFERARALGIGEEIAFP